MKQNQKGFGVVEVLIILLVAGLIGGATFYFIKGKTRVSISNEGQSFSFDIGTSATTTTRSSQGKTIEYFQATPKGSPVALIATVFKPTSSNADLKDTCKYDELDATILSKTHTVCDQKHKVFVANFDNNGTWYQAVIFAEDMKSELKQSDAIRLLESIKSN